MVSSSLTCKYNTRMDVTDRYKRSGLLRCRINYGYKNKFNSKGPGLVRVGSGAVPIKTNELNCFFSLDSTLLANIRLGWK